MTVDRKTGDDGSLYVPNPCVSVAGTIQPGVLAAVLKAAFFDSGFEARLFYTNPVAPPLDYNDDEVDEEAVAGYERVLRVLLALGDPAGPVTLPFTPGAQGRYKEVVNDFAREMGRVPSGRLREHLAKGKGHVAGLALTHYVVRCAEEGTAPVAVDEEAVVAAAEIVRWQAYEHARVLKMLGKLDVATVQALAAPAPAPSPEDRVLNALPDEFTTGEFERAAREGVGLPERTSRDWLKRLVEAGRVWKLRQGVYRKATAPDAVRPDTDEGGRPVAEDVPGDNPSPGDGPITLWADRPFDPLANGERVEARIEGEWVEASVVRYEDGVEHGSADVLVVRPLGSVAVVGVTDPADIRPARW